MNVIIEPAAKLALLAVFVLMFAKGAKINVAQCGIVNVCFTAYMFHSFHYFFQLSG